LHLPVQSGSNRILKVMQRGYTVEDFQVTLQAFRSAIPSLTVSTDMIVGFPSESEQEFEDSLALLRKARPDIVNISRFGPRPGTKAAAMDSPISQEESKKRSTTMTHLVRQISRENNERWIGWRGSVLIDERVKNALVGRNFSYKPCLVMSREYEPEKCLGLEREIKITGATASTLRGDFL
jgi:threonylcarbamoyladenosine tRNA methylthiotransferase CDKAL1